MNWNTGTRPSKVSIVPVYAILRQTRAWHQGSVLASPFIQSTCSHTLTPVCFRLVWVSSLCQWLPHIISLSTIYLSFFMSHNVATDDWTQTISKRGFPLRVCTISWWLQAFYFIVTWQEEQCICFFCSEFFLSIYIPLCKHWTRLDLTIW